MGVQHVIAMFGATVLAPILMGFDPNIAILMSGVGTLIFFFVTGGRVPSYLGSSFAFIGVVIAATGYAGKGPERQHRAWRWAASSPAAWSTSLIGAHRAGRRHRLDRALHAAGGHRRGGGGDRPEPGRRADQEHGRPSNFDAWMQAVTFVCVGAGGGVHARHGAAPADPGRPDRWRAWSTRCWPTAWAWASRSTCRGIAQRGLVRRCRPSPRRCSAAARCC